jgi:hypothetical protein
MIRLEEPIIWQFAFRNQVTQEENDIKAPTPPRGVTLLPPSLRRGFRQRQTELMNHEDS